MCIEQLKESFDNIFKPDKKQVDIQQKRKDIVRRFESGELDDDLRKIAKDVIQKYIKEPDPFHNFGNRINDALDELFFNLPWHLSGGLYGKVSDRLWKFYREIE